MLLQFLSTLQGACHSTIEKYDATGSGDKDDIVAGGEDEIGVGGDVDIGAAMHSPMEEGRTLVEEEGALVMDPTTNATSLDMWPCYNPTA